MRGSIVNARMIELTEFSISAPSGSVTGVIAVGLSRIVSSPAETIPAGAPIPEKPGNYILFQTLSCVDAVSKAQAVGQLLKLRREGSTILLVSHDEQLLESCADEIWWLDRSVVIARGDPGEVLHKYRSHVSETLRRCAETESLTLSTALRQGDGRASLEAIELSSSVLVSGDPASLKVVVRFNAPVADPVIGIMIRTRIGLNVYGTNTELEELKLGPVESGDVLAVTFCFTCSLCPGHYTITAASHDPDGVWHDWLEDAIGFAVTDSRYTAGVANLKAVTSVSRTSQTPGR